MSNPMVNNPTCTCGVHPWPVSGTGLAMGSFKPVKVLHDDNCPVIAPFLKVCEEVGPNLAAALEAEIFDLLVAP